jgi:hypothetical protein
MCNLGNVEGDWNNKRAAIIYAELTPQKGSNVIITTKGSVDYYNQLMELAY